MHDCNKEEVIEIIKDDLAEIKKDVKSLLQWKFTIVGGWIVIIALFGFIMRYV